MAYTGLCVAIEGKKISVETRRWTHSLKRLADGTIAMGFKTGIRSKAKIVAPYRDPKNAKDNAAHKNLGDELIAESLDGWYISKTPTKPAIVNATGTHKASSCIICCGAYARIQIPHDACKPENNKETLACIKSQRLLDT
jgi:hypothetical protein